MKLRGSLFGWFVVPAVTFGVALGGFLALASPSTKLHLHVHGLHRVAVAGVAAGFANSSAEFAGAGCSIIWTGNGGTQSWHTAANWSPPREPGPGDVACIPGGAKVVIKHDVNVKGFVNRGTLVIAGGNVNVTGTARSG